MQCYPAVTCSWRVQLLRKYSRDAVALRLKHLSLAQRGAETHSIVVMVRAHPAMLERSWHRPRLWPCSSLPCLHLHSALPAWLTAPPAGAAGLRLGGWRLPGGHPASRSCRGADRPSLCWQDIPGIEAGSLYSKVDSLLFFLPKGLKAKVKARILAERDRAMQRAMALRRNKQAGQGKAEVASVGRLSWPPRAGRACHRPCARGARHLTARRQPAQLHAPGSRQQPACRASLQAGGCAVPASSRQHPGM